MKLQNEIFGPHEKFYPFNPSDVTKSEQDLVIITSLGYHQFMFNLKILRDIFLL